MRIYMFMYFKNLIFSFMYLINYFILLLEIKIKIKRYFWKKIIISKFIINVVLLIFGKIGFIYLKYELVWLIKWFWLWLFYIFLNMIWEFFIIKKKILY